MDEYSEMYTIINYMHTKNVQQLEVRIIILTTVWNCVSVSNMQVVNLMNNPLYHKNFIEEKSID